MKRGRSPSDCIYNKLQWSFMRNYGISLRSHPVAHTNLLLILMQPHLHTLLGLRTFAICKEAHGQSALTWEGITFRCLINMATSHTMFLPSILSGTRLQCILQLCWYLPTLENTFFFLRLPIGQYGPVSQLSRSEERCTGPFNWGEAHCAGEKVKRKIGPFLRKSLKNQTRTRTQQKGAKPATATRNPLARLPGARAKEEKTTTNKRLHKQILVRLNVLDLQWTIL